MKDMQTSFESTQVHRSSVQHVYQQPTITRVTATSTGSQARDHPVLNVNSARGEGHNRQKLYEIDGHRLA